MRLRSSKWLDWLDSRAAWQFLGILYLVRWCFIVPYIIAVMYTTAFHAAINIVGWTMIVSGSSA